MILTNNTKYLVTGGMGCIGAWTLYHLVKAGQQAVSFDLSDQRDRLNLLLSPQEQQPITLKQGDLTDTAQVLDVFKSQQITHVIHLAALQIPFCQANPVLGAQVNVVGTLNVFEAARQTGVNHLTYASSIAIYGPDTDYSPGPLAHEAIPAPRTLYGVYKVANEGTARVYWQDHHLSSTTLRPYTVYGVGRDQGLTSEPTKAMLAAAAGQPYEISFGGIMQVQWASDIARQFIAAATHPLEGAYGFNFGTKPTPIADVVALINAAAPGTEITYQDKLLPFAAGCDGSAMQTHFPQVYDTPLPEGIEQTIAHFKQCLAANLIRP